MWLEAAIRRCVRFDSPTLDSILEVMHDIYGQLDRLYHDSGRLEAPGGPALQTVPTRIKPGERHHLAGTLKQWDEKPGPRSIRRRVAAAFTVGSAQFIDPVDYCRFLDHELADGVNPAEVLPALHRGLAHGDLHGRNLLVGIDESERAIFPALFDYECFDTDNLIGWDFVEMETELKIRIYQSIFAPANLAERARQVQEFEWELTQATQACHERRHWPRPDAPIKDPRGRLRAILLAIRAEACRTLGRLRGESLDWLAEYLFLLACYGVTTVRYENQNEQECAAAYVSAGVAAAYLERLRGARPKPSADLQTLLAARHPTYQTPLAVARAWSRSGDPDELRQAELLLAHLVEQYPTALHVWYERAFNLTRQKRVYEALNLLKTIDADFGGHLDEDTYGLWGRCYKEPGDIHRLTGQNAPDKSAGQKSEFKEADDAYRLAIEQYTKAYAVAAGFFPGINVATLTFLRAGLCARMGRSKDAHDLREEARQRAKELQDASSQWRERLPDDAVWKRATEAEAAVLCCDWDYAVARYLAALGQTPCASHHPESMGKQLRRILDGYRLLNEPVPIELFLAITPLREYIQP